MAKKKIILHLVNTLDNNKVQAYLNHFPIKERPKYYAVFWIILESTNILNNRYQDVSELLINRSEYASEMILDIGAVVFNKAIKAMVELGLLVKEGDYYYSPFQRLYYESRQKKNNLKESEVENLKKINERLEDKIKFLQSRIKK